MAPQNKMICRSPSPPEADDGEDEWPVYGVVGEDVDVFGISRYVLARFPDLTNSHLTYSPTAMRQARASSDIYSPTECNFYQ